MNKDDALRSVLQIRTAVTFVVLTWSVVCLCDSVSRCAFANMGKQETALKAMRAHKSRIQVLEEELEVERMGYVCARRVYKRELSTSYTQRFLRDAENKCRC